MYIFFFDGIKTKDFFIGENKYKKNVITNVIYSIMTIKYDNYKVYLDNFSNF